MTIIIPVLGPWKPVSTTTPGSFQQYNRVARAERRTERVSGWCPSSTNWRNADWPGGQLVGLGIFPLDLPDQMKEQFKSYQTDRPGEG